MGRRMPPAATFLGEWGDFVGTSVGIPALVLRASSASTVLVTTLGFVVTLLCDLVNLTTIASIKEEPRLDQFP